MENKKIAKVSKKSKQNNSETFTNENDKKKFLKKDIYFHKKDKKLLII